MGDFFRTGLFSFFVVDVDVGLEDDVVGSPKAEAEVVTTSLSKGLSESSPNGLASSSVSSKGLWSEPDDSKGLSAIVNSKQVWLRTVLMVMVMVMVMVMWLVVGDDDGDGGWW